MTLIFGHRGSSGTHPENTWAAFKEAKRVGAEGIELDVHLTKDEKIAVIHDASLGRTTTGHGRVCDHTMEELQSLDAGSWFSENFTGERIPELPEILAWAKKMNMLVNIELKYQKLCDNEGIVGKVLNEIENHDSKEDVILSSFNHYALKTAKKLMPEVECAVLYEEKMFKPWEYAATVEATSLHPHRNSMDVKMITEAEERGYRVRFFTVNKEADMERLMKAGCTAIFTDYPAVAWKVRERIQ